MDKQKINPALKPKLNRAIPSGDFIALGKTTASKSKPDLEGVVKVPVRKPNVASISHKRKDPVDAGLKHSATKRLKDEHAVDEDSAAFIKFVEAQPNNLETEVSSAIAQQNTNRVDGLLCAAVRLLKLSRLKPDPMLYLSLTDLAKTHAKCFQSKAVTDTLLLLLRRDNLNAGKTKPNTTLCIMASNIFMHVYAAETTWPLAFLKAYIEDALSDRSWVDNESNKEFVNNIVAVFGTKGVKPLRAGLDEASTKSEPENVDVADDLKKVFNRFPSTKDMQAVSVCISEAVKEQLNKRQVIDGVSRNFLRFLAIVCGYGEVRLVASQRIETWIQNPKLTRPAQELLMSVSMNCDPTYECNVEVIANLIKMRLKTKALTTHYVSCIKEMISKHPSNLGIAMKYIVYNELSQQRNANNISVLLMMFTHEPKKSAKCLSSVFLELLFSREDYLRAIRAVFREIMRSLKFDFNVVEFCMNLLQDDTLDEKLIDQPVKERVFSSILDLTCLACFLSISPAIKDLSNALSKGETIDLSVLHSFQTKMSLVQNYAVGFFYTKVMMLYKPKEKDFIQGLKKALFLDAAEKYCLKDSWPPESDRQSFLQLIQEVPLMEDTLLRLHCLGLSDDYPVNCAAMLEMIEKIVYRSASLKSGLPSVEIKRKEILQMLLSLSAYLHPRDIVLPEGYEPPSLAISSLYWKCWVILVVLAAINPATIGKFIWEEYPTGRLMIEMVITGSYVFPPLTSKGFTTDDILANELQVSRAEKDDIIVFEGYLAAATSGAVITESTSLLISQLMNLEPCGLPRKPPQAVINRLKKINDNLGLNRLLCQNREPDFLLNIIQAQGSPKSMTWLADLVQSSEGTLSALPIQCLCEFLLMGHTHKMQPIKRKVAARLRDILHGDDHASSRDLAVFFIKRWFSCVMREREGAVRGLRSIVLFNKQCDQWLDVSSAQSPYYEDYDWFHNMLPQLSAFATFLPELLSALRKALHVDVKMCRLRAFILFHIEHANSEELSMLILKELSTFITQRFKVASKLLTHGTGLYLAVKGLFERFYESMLQGAHSAEDSDTVDVACHSGLHDGKTINVQMAQATLFLLAKQPFTESEGSMLSSLSFFHSSHDSRRLLTENLKTFVLQSSNKRMVEKLLHSLSIDELLKLAKFSSFPLTTVNEALVILDQMVPECEHLKELLRKVCVPELVDWVSINRSLGATAGLRFLKALNSEEVGAPAEEQVAHSVVEEADMEVGKENESIPIKRFEVLKSVFCATNAGDRQINVAFNDLKRNLAVDKIQNKQDKHDVISSLNQLVSDHHMLDRLNVFELRIMLKLNDLRCDSGRLLMEQLHGVDSVKDFRNLVEGVYKERLPIGQIERKFDCVLESFVSGTIDENLLLQYVKNISVDDLASVDPNKVTKVILMLCKRCSWLVEALLKALLRADETFCVHLIVGLLNEIDGRYMGVLVDALELLSPELLPLQRNSKLIFSRESPIKSYFISALTDKARSSSLQGYLSWILNLTTDINCVNSKTCLEFITALVENPRLWQGTEDTSSNNNFVSMENSDLLNLSFDEMDSFAKHVLTVTFKNRTTLDDDIIGQDEHLKMLFKLTSRPKYKNYGAARKLVRFSEQLCPFKLKKDLLFLLPGNRKSQVDWLVHQLLRMIGESADVSSNALESLANHNFQMAVKYPRLFLSKLPLIISMMNSRSCDSQLFFVCSFVMDLLNVLQAEIFIQNEKNRDTMQLILDVFLRILQSVNLNRDQRANILDQFVRFLLGFISSDNNDAVEVLKWHKYAFIDLLYVFPETTGLSSISTFIASEGKEACLKVSGNSFYESSQYLAVQDFLSQLSQITDDQSLMTLTPRRDLAPLLLDCFTSPNTEIVELANIHTPRLLHIIDSQCGKILKHMYKAVTTCSTDYVHLNACIRYLNADHFVTTG